MNGSKPKYVYLDRYLREKEQVKGELNNFKEFELRYGPAVDALISQTKSRYRILLITSVISALLSTIALILTTTC